MSIQIEEYRDSQGGYATRHLKQWRADLCGIDLHLVWSHEAKSSILWAPGTLDEPGR